MGKTNKHKLKELVAVLAGNVFEFYAFILFVMCAPYISKVFFTPDDPNGLILVYCISFCGYFSRPLGALVIGHFADQYSRKLALSVTVFSMGAVTFSIGLLPSYSVAGYLGASLLVERFPADVRCSGVSFVFNLAVSLFSDVFPAVSSFVVSYYGVDGVTYLLVAIVFISIFALLVHNPRVKKSYKLMLANS